MKIKIAITSLITLVIAVASPFEANAVEYEYVKNLIYTDGGISAVQSSNVVWTQQTGTSIWLGTVNANRSWTPTFIFKNAVSLSEGDYAVVNFTFINSPQTVPDTCLVGLGGWEVIDCKNSFQAEPPTESIQKAIIGCDHKIQNPDGTWMCDKWITLLNTSGTTNPTNPIMINKYQYILRWNGQSNSTDRIGLGGLGLTLDGNYGISVLSLGTISFYKAGATLTDIYNYLQEHDVNQGQQEAGQQAQQEGQQASDTSGTQVSQGTQSLLSAITGFVGVISNATPTNCRITGDMGALDLGELDFCQDNPPAIITTIGTLILIGITIPITIWVIKKIISMFRSFTNG